jgi:nucleoside-diphosphate-sugar epimerase
MQRVVSFSSVQVFGCWEDEGEPDYLPIDDDHPRRASRPYGSSKRMVEDLCEMWTGRSSIPTVVLRPVVTLGDEGLARIDRRRLEYGTFVHVADVADAVSRALVAPIEGHVRLTLSAAGDVDTSRARAVLGWVPTHVRSRRSQLWSLLRR